MEVIDLLKGASIPVIFIVIGFVLLFLALGVRPADHLVRINVNAWFAGVLSFVFLSLGLALQVAPAFTASLEKKEEPPASLSDLDIRERLDSGIKKYDEKKYAEAIVDLREVLKHWPNDELTLLSLGKAYYQNDKHESALQILDTLLTINPNKWEAYEVKGWIYATKGERMKAIELYEKALSINPSERYILHDIAINYRIIGKYDLSLSAINKRIEKDSTFYYPYYIRGLTYRDMGKIDEAISDFTNCIKYDHGKFYEKECRENIEKLQKIK
ncbi:MAG: tetratricopeptide repeat protein [Candidatus Thiothrix sulfatifontis]|nr:MAG: tetratricopeptide repeat protein [Candidatus Thiothrix sulfatifontis]